MHTFALVFIQSTKLYKKKDSKVYPVSINKAQIEIRAAALLKLKQLFTLIFNYLNKVTLPCLDNILPVAVCPCIMYTNTPVDCGTRSQLPSQPLLISLLS